MRLINLFLYTLCGTLLLCTPFAIDRTLVNGIVMGKLFWAQGIISLLAVATIFAVLSRDDKPSFSFRREDALPLLIAGWNLAIYPWGLNPEPQKLLFGGGLLALWFLLRSLLQRYPWLKGYLLFALVLTGIAEAIEGIQQLEGYAYSNHSLFPLTGTFFNPGPYSGYLAIILPIGLDLFLRKSLPTPIRYTGAAYALLCLIVLPAGMSRSAWIAACIACAWVYLTHRLDWERLNRWQKRHRFSTILALIIGCGLLGIGGYRLYSLKKDSADGRVLLWKITTRAIAEKPVQGTGLGGFPHGIRVQRIPAHRHGARHHRINPIHRMAQYMALQKPPTPKIRLRRGAYRVLSLRIRLLPPASPGVLDRIDHFRSDRHERG